MTRARPRLATSWQRPGIWLATGAALLATAHMRWGVALCAWLAPIALLRYLRLTRGVRSRVCFAAVLCAAWITATAKIVTAPLPPAFALFGVGVAALQLPGYLASDWVRRRLGDGFAIVTFSAVMVVLEWSQHRLTELGSWGAAAYTQLDDLPLLQLAAVFGTAGISALLYWLAASAEAVLAWRIERERPRDGLRQLCAAACALVVVHACGWWRLAHAPQRSLRVAAIGTDATFDGRVMPTRAERARTLDHLLADTQRAADAGAELAVWNEAAALVPAGEEGRFLSRVRAAAARGRLHVVAAYIVPISERPLRFENKYRWLRPDGTLDHTYFKHHPAPGEPALVGKGALPVVSSAFGRLSGALCYDYDFPELAREHGARAIDLVALPSSDWRGIDPIHTQMASLRAIEQGVSIVRSTRFGLSAGIDPYGRMVARRSSFESRERVLLLSLPRHGVATFYRAWGDVFVYACQAWLSWVLALVGWRAARRQPAADGRGAVARAWSALAASGRT